MSSLGEYSAQVNRISNSKPGMNCQRSKSLASNMRSNDAEPFLVDFRAGLDRLRVSLASIDSPLFELLLRRMDNYLTELADPTDEQIGDIETFLDLMHGILNGEIGGEVNEAEFFRSLPVRRPARPGRLPAP